ncbi:hypothetical protein D3C73_1273730 [compost metagenome]
MFSIWVGLRNCGFLMLTTRWVCASATTRSVCRARKAGNCRMSATSATGAACQGSCTSVMTGTPNSFLTASKIFMPSSRPGPR